MESITRQHGNVWLSNFNKKKTFSLWPCEKNKYFRFENFKLFLLVHQSKASFRSIRLETNEKAFTYVLDTIQWIVCNVFKPLKKFKCQ